MSPYVRSLRERIGHDYLLLPGVTAVFRRGDEFLLARQRDTERWSLVGGGIEPGETPRAAVAREVREELGVTPAVTGIVGAYGGASLETTLPNGDRVGGVTVVFACDLPTDDFVLEAAELIETRWFTLDEIVGLDRHEWIDEVLRDAVG
ncbi:NUDIX domain-containing protein [Humibacter ginsenosidimutans]|uniref:NUDIX domain-containing protein n=1 Tax=Humibacter ginsenosidimutans TaxID=2599293 RepID=A0A5B8M8M5_9MICO|nr:NUDIX domain-containing protein [Humibacter ginsenosidimutans]QDZ16773.1 NUDIX domain-containing protein [Humibacter ginsenosidimutans]